MNDHDWDIIQRELDKPLSPYEKVLFLKDRRDRWKQQQKENTERKFDWFIKDALGEFYNYDPGDY